MRIAITGSNGFIGSELAKYMLAQGHEVLLLQRKKPEVLAKGTTYQLYDLNWPERILDLKGVDALVHTAFMPITKNNNGASVNINCALRLFSQCAANGIQFVFLSSMSAHADALSDYGVHKFKLEKRLDISKCLILRLGLVIGQDGLFKRIYNSVQKMPFTLLIAGGEQPIQPIYIGDVVRVIDRCIAEKLTGKFTLAVNRVYTMKELSATIAAKAGKKPLFISVPYWLVSLGIWFVELLHLPFPVSNENLLGLEQLRSEDTGDDLRKLSVELLDLDASIKQL